MVSGSTFDIYLGLFGWFFGPAWCASSRRVPELPVSTSLESFNLLLKHSP